MYLAILLYKTLDYLLYTNKNRCKVKFYYKRHKIATFRFLNSIKKT